jgi:hypothetical protein
MCILLAVLVLLFGFMGWIGMTIMAEFFKPELGGLLRDLGSLAVIGLSILSVVGWWLFSTPDEAIMGHDTGDKPRKILRICVIIAAIMIVVDAVAQRLLYQYVGFYALVELGSLLGWLAWIVQFFVSLLYIQWLATRIPDAGIVRTATLYLWLLPLIYIVGFCVFLIGPLVATIMYLLLLYNLRVRLREIQWWMRKQEASAER